MHWLGDGQFRLGGCGYLNMRMAFILDMCGWRQSETSVFLHAEQGNTAAHVLETSVSLQPGKASSQTRREIRARVL